MSLLVLNGWPGQWSAFNNIEMHEAGWNPHIHNLQGSGAYGIAQALGHGKGAATQGTEANEYGGWGFRFVGNDAKLRNGYWRLQTMKGFIKNSHRRPNTAWRQQPRRVY